MRTLTKVAKPSVLEEHESEWLDAYKADRKNSTKRYRYRHRDIKTALLSETGYKCIYCESKIGHNTPGDVEHKVPSSRNIDRHFDWENLTTACTECNRRKNAYYNEALPFLDPYTDDVEALLHHLGPIVQAKPGTPRAEITINILELHTCARMELVARKMVHLEALRHLVERYVSERSPELKQVLRRDLEALQERNAEYSAMVIDALRAKNISVDSGEEEA